MPPPGSPLRSNKTLYILIWKKKIHSRSPSLTPKPPVSYLKNIPVFNFFFLYYLPRNTDSHGIFHMCYVIIAKDSNSEALSPDNRHQCQITVRVNHYPETESSDQLFFVLQELRWANHRPKETFSIFIVNVSRKRKTLWGKNEGKSDWKQTSGP